MDHTIIQSLDTILLFLADLGLGLDDILELDDIILDHLNVDRTGDIVHTHHLLDICFELVHILPIDLRIDCFTPH